MRITPKTVEILPILSIVKFGEFRHFAGFYAIDGTIIVWLNGGCPVCLCRPRAGTLNPRIRQPVDWGLKPGYCWKHRYSDLWQSDSWIPTAAAEIGPGIVVCLLWAATNDHSSPHIKRVPPRTLCTVDIRLQQSSPADHKPVMASDS